MKAFADPLSIYTHFDAELWHDVRPGDLIHQDDNTSDEVLMLKKADGAVFELSFACMSGEFNAEQASFAFEHYDPAHTRFPESYCKTRILLPLLRMLRSGIGLHASAVSMDGEATLLLAPSGVGKSTCGAALMAFAEHTQMLSDDTVVITHYNDTYYVLPATSTFAMRHDLIPRTNAFVGTAYGSIQQKFFLSVRPERVENNAVPVKRLVFLYHGASRLQPTRSADVLPYFFAQQFVLSNAPIAYRRTQFSKSTSFLSSIPCFKLGVDFSSVEGIERAVDTLI